MLRPLRHHADFFRRFLAGGAAALVLALGMFAASPVLHDWLHGAELDADTATSDHGCAVVLFASGVSVPLGTIAPRAAVRGMVRVGAPGRTRDFFGVAALSPSTGARAAVGLS